MAKILGVLSRSHGFFSGAGYIAGFAPGLVTVATAPAARHVELRHRGSRVVVEVKFSAPNGTYVFHGLALGEQFDLIGRDWGNYYNDVIVSRVQAVPYAVSLSGTLVVNDAANTLTGAIAVAGGLHPLSVTVVAGAAPTGITFGMSGRAVKASGVASNGAYSWTLRVTAANGVYADVACVATFT